MLKLCLQRACNSIINTVGVPFRSRPLRYIERTVRERYGYVKITVRLLYILVKVHQHQIICNLLFFSLQYFWII